MSRQQVRDILGTPLLTSIFHGDRWDYVFTLERRKVETQKYRLTVYFKGDALERFEGDTMPTEAEFVSSFDAVRPVEQGAGPGGVRGKPQQVSLVTAFRLAAARACGRQQLPPAREPGALGGPQAANMTSIFHHRLAVAGASGRMGHMLIEAILTSEDCVLAGALDIAASPAIGQDADGLSGADRRRRHHRRSALRV